MLHPVWDSTKREPMSVEQQAQLVVATNMAFIRICRGDPKDDDPDQLAVAVNVSLVLCEMGIGAEYSQLTLDAQDALMRAGKRSGDGKSFNFDGPGLTVWREFLELNEAHLQAAGHLDLMKALATVDLRIRQGHVLRIGPA